jgi:shikimate dehydrogenase
VITAATRLLGVVGWPIAHSRSPAMHNAALAALDLDYVYLAFGMPPEQLMTALAGLREAGARGLNITIPHKEAALAFGEPDEIARSVGAVNTLVFEGDAVLGTNTDVHGFRALCAESGARTDGRAVVLGSGGAARAVIAALMPTAREIVMLTRTRRELYVGGVLHTGIPWAPMELTGADLVVDATPRGLDDAQPPPDLSALPAHATVLDLVARRDTPLLRAARARGLHAAAGAGMLLHQGAAAFERWTGRAAPLEVMRRALDDALD